MLKQIQDSSIVASILERGFNSSMIEVNGTALHYVRGGNGPAILLIHGFPQDWFEYHLIMPELAEQFNVVSVDLRDIAGTLWGFRCRKSCRGSLSTTIRSAAQRCVRGGS